MHGTTSTATTRDASADRARWCTQGQRTGQWHRWFRAVPVPAGWCRGADSSIRGPPGRQPPWISGRSRVSWDSARSPARCRCPPSHEARALGMSRDEPTQMLLRHTTD